MQKVIVLFVVLILGLSTQAQKATICGPIVAKGTSISDLGTDQIQLILSAWKADTLITKNYNWDIQKVDTLKQLSQLAKDPLVIKKIYKDLIAFYAFHKKTEEVSQLKAEIQKMELSELRDQNEILKKSGDSLRALCMDLQSKYSFGQELIGQIEGEQEMWFFVAVVLACLLIIVTILYFLKNGKTEKEIVYKEKKVVVHEPAEDQGEMMQKIADLEKLYKTSLQSIQMQDAEKIEQQKINQEAVQFLKEAQAELKKIQENKTMTAEDFMRLSNAVQRAITKL
ncbi:MAG: hypothetical protein RLY35_2062 [Bacteroidota bacterium]|jgi:hypothetical protein